MLSYRVANADPPGYRIKFDGVEVGSISRRHQHVENRNYWRWGVDVMPLMDHGGRPPDGDAESFPEALAAFKAAFAACHAGASYRRSTCPAGAN
jgi:hypothetical protein